MLQTSLNRIYDYGDPGRSNTYLSKEMICRSH